MTPQEIKMLKLEGSVEKLEEAADGKLSDIIGILNDFGLDIPFNEYHDKVMKIRYLLDQTDTIMREVYKLKKITDPESVEEAPRV